MTTKKVSLTFFLLLTLLSLLTYGPARAQAPVPTPAATASETPVTPPEAGQPAGTETPCPPVEASPAEPATSEPAASPPPGSETSAPQPEAGDPPAPEAQEPVPQIDTAPAVELLVQFDSPAALEAMQAALEQYGLVRSGLSQLGVLRLQVPQERLEETLAAVSALPGVAGAETSQKTLKAELTPNDTYYASQQYALPLINAPQGWEVSTGSAAVVIAVLDSGINYSHPDLAGKIVSGYDVLEDDDIAQDYYGHGTHVSGIAAALTDNARGVAGVDWQARIMPVRVLDGMGQGSNADAAEGILWATDNGAQVINLSLGGSKSDPLLEAAVNYAYSRGVVLVASVGNIEGVSTSVHYPAAYPQVIAVAACDQASQRTSYSRYGPEVDVTAPGSDIYSTWLGTGYNYLSGTSMAASFVTGEAALLRGLNPALSNEQVASLIRTYTLNLGDPGWDMYTGSGLIQLDLALLAARPAPPLPPEEPQDGRASKRRQTAPGTPASPPSTVYDDADPAFRYTGGWTASAEQSGPYLGTLHQASAAGERAELPITGGQVAIIYNGQAGQAVLEVYLVEAGGAAVKIGSINQDNAEPRSRQEWLSPVFAQGSYTLRLVHAGPDGKSVNIDAVIVTASPAP